MQQGVQTDTMMGVAGKQCYVRFPGGGEYRLMFAGYGAAGLSEPLAHYSIFFGELQTPS